MDTQRKSRSLLADERGATAVEYGLIVSLIVLAMIGALGSVARSTTAIWDDVKTNVSGT